MSIAGLVEDAARRQTAASKERARDEAMVSAALGDFAWTIRPMDPDVRKREVSFVGETCCKVRQPKGQVQWGLWNSIHRPLVDEYMDGAKILVADVGDSVLLGFIVVGAEGWIRMLYVKTRFRGFGIGLDLIKAANLDLPLLAFAPTASWTAWCCHHGIPCRATIDGQHWMTIDLPARQEPPR